jgi:predicted deacylase
MANSLEIIEITGVRPGATLVVTAGMDGDEYAGIEAARALADRFADRQFAGTLRIVPVVNVAGFAAGTSRNPVDGRFPKHLFPGNPQGSDSEQLIHAFASGPLVGADAWLDLHGGASDEHLRPFLWAWRTGVADVDALIERFVAVSGAERAIIERAGWRSKPRKLSRMGCAYVMAESGELGKREPADIARHVAWAGVLMSVLGMLDPLPAPAARPAVFHRVRETVARHDGTWDPETLQADGELLWWKKAGTVRRGDTLSATARP